MCAFAFPIPLATTLRVSESRKVDELIRVGEDFLASLASHSAGGDAEEDPNFEGDPESLSSVFELSTIAIRLIREAVVVDPEVRSWVREDKSVLDRILRFFFIRRG